MIEINSEEKVKLAQQYLEKASNMCYMFSNERSFAKFNLDITSVEEILQNVMRAKELLEDIPPESVVEPKLLNE